MTITVIVSHDIKDWDIFKQGIEPPKEVIVPAAAAGITAKAYKKVDSAKAVYAIGKIPSHEVFEEFFSDPDFHKHMDDIGVIQPVNVTVLEEI
jgi:hypothetical protein